MTNMRIAYALKRSSCKMGSWKTTKKKDMTARTKNFNAGVKLLENCEMEEKWRSQ